MIDLVAIRIGPLPGTFGFRGRTGFLNTGFLQVEVLLWPLFGFMFGELSLSYIDAINTFSKMEDLLFSLVQTSFHLSMNC